MTEKRTDAETTLRTAEEYNRARDVSAFDDGESVPVEGPLKSVVSVRLPRPLYEQVKQHAEAEGKSVSQVIREAFEHYL